MIVDDHTMVREGLRMALEAEEDIRVVGEAGAGEQAIRLAGELKPDLVLMDVAMPGMTGIDACQEIRRLLPDTKVVMLTASGEKEAVTASMLAGATGYVLKIAGTAELVRAIRTVADGRMMLPAETMNEVVDEWRRLLIDARQRDVEQLTRREGDVLMLVAQGLTNREVGGKLVISENTARNMVGSVLGKLGLKNRSELVRWAFEHKLMSAPPRGTGVGPSF
jgi:DNA-binding NarL/FixJ family response regulator